MRIKLLVFIHKLTKKYPILKTIFAFLVWLIPLIVTTLIIKACFEEIKQETKNEKPIAKQIGEFFGEIQKDFKEGFEETSGDTLK